MPLDYTTLMREVARGAVPAVLLLHGPETLLLDDAVRRISLALFSDVSGATFGREVLDAREVTAEAIARSALTLPFLGGQRLVIVRHAQVLPQKGSGALTEYLAAPNPTTCLLLVADESLRANRDRRHDHWLLGAVPDRSAVEVSGRKGRDLERWLQERTAADGVELSAEAARLLVQLVGDDMAALVGEARKAALAGGPSNTRVGVDEVLAVVGAHRTGDIFELTRAIERSQLGPALTLLDRLLDAGVEPLAILGLLTRELHTTWSVKEWARGGRSVDQIARELRRPRPVIESVIARAQSVPHAELARGLERCWNVECRLKSGGAPRPEMTVLIASLC